MHLKIKVLEPNLKEWYKERSNHADDSGFDLYVPQTQAILNSTLSNKIDHKVQMSATDDNGNPVGYWLIPRSSIINTPLRMANSVGLIDAGYRGNIMSVVDNHAKSEDESYVVFEKDRLFQVVAFDGSPITFEIVDELDETARGEGGYGSTGK